MLQPLKKIKNYQSIFFDLDNTIWDFDKNSYEALKITFNQYDLQNQIPEFDPFYATYKTINENLWAEYRINEITKKQLIVQRFEKTFEQFGVFIDPLCFNDDYLSVMPDQKVLFDHTIEVLDYLKGKRYAMYIITNGFREVQYKKLENAGISNYFRRVFVSEEIKSQKPDKEIFEVALKSSNSRKQTSIMIGDSWEIDVLGALKTGIDQVHINHRGSKIIPGEVLKSVEISKTFTFLVNNLQQLTSFL